MDINALIVIILTALAKAGFWGFWCLSKRLDKMNEQNIALKKTIMVLHQKEFSELRDSMHELNKTIIDGEVRSLSLGVGEDIAKRYGDVIWAKDVK